MALHAEECKGCGGFIFEGQKVCNYCGRPRTYKPEPVRPEPVVKEPVVRQPVLVTSFVAGPALPPPPEPQVALRADTEPGLSGRQGCWLALAVMVLVVIGIIYLNSVGLYYGA